MCSNLYSHVFLVDSRLYKHRKTNVSIEPCCDICYGSVGDLFMKHPDTRCNAQWISGIHKSFQSIAHCFQHIAHSGYIVVWARSQCISFLNPLMRTDIIHGVRQNRTARGGDIEEAGYNISFRKYPVFLNCKACGTEWICFPMRIPLFVVTTVQLK